jgi:hypothetical protein
VSLAIGFVVGLLTGGIMMLLRVIASNYWLAWQMLGER